MADGKVIIETDLDSSGIEKGLSKLGGLAKAGLGVVTKAAMATGTALVAAGTAAIVVGSNFEEGMSKVSAISGATGKDLDALTAKAKEMGAKTKFSATDAASAFEYMAMAGWKTTDMLGGIDGIMNLAAASGEDLALVSDIVTDAITAFGLSAADSGHFADVLAAASSNANTNVSMLGESFKYVAPIAGAMKYSVEDTSLALGLMANASIKGSMAGTSLKTALANLASPTDKMEGVMKKYGISLQNTDGSMKSLGEVIQILRDKMGGLDEATQTAAASTLFGKEAMSGMLAIINASEQDYQKLSAAVSGADGAAQGMADTMQNNLKGEITILKSGLEGLGIQIYESMEKRLKDAAKAGVDAVGRVSDAFAKGGFKGAVKEAGKLVGEFLDEIEKTDPAVKGVVRPLRDFADAGMKLGKTVLPPLAKSVKLICENTDTLIPILGAAVAGFAAFQIIDKVSKWYKVASVASMEYAAAMATEGVAVNANSVAHLLLAQMMTAAELVVGVFTGNVTLATLAELGMAAATKALDAALNMLPLIAIIGATAALAAVVLKTGEDFSEVRDKAAELTEAQKEQVEAVDKLNESYKATQEAKDEAIQGSLVEFEHYQNLADELKNITDENGRVKKGYEDRAGVIAGELSDALGMEIELTDGMIKNYDEVCDKIDEVIQKKKAEAIQTALAQDITKAYQESSKALEEYTKSQKELEKQQKKVTDAQKEYDDACKLWEENKYSVNADEYAKKMAEAGAKLEGAKDKQDELNKSTEKAKETLEGYQDQIQQYNDISAALQSEDAAKIQEALDQITSGYKSYSEEALKSSEEARKAMMEQSVNAVDGLRAIQTGAVEVSDELHKTSVDGVLRAIDDFNKLPGGVQEAVTKIGPEANKAMVQALVQANLDGQLTDEGKKDAAAFIKSLEGMDEGAKKEFAMAAAGALEGMEGFEDIISLADTNVDAFLQELATRLEVHSPSRAVKRIFAQVMPGAAEGIDEGKDGVLAQAGEFISEFLGEFSDSGIFEGLANIGKEAMSQFGIGAASQKGNSKKAGLENAKAANTGAASVKPVSTGTNFAKSFGSGITGMAKSVKGTATGLANSAKSGAESVNPTNSGTIFGNYFSNGVKNTMNIVGASGKSIANSAKTGAAAVNPSDTGKKFGTSFNTAIAGQNGASQSAGKTLSTKAKTGLSSVATSSVGKNFGQGFAGGISSMIGSAVSAATRLASSALSSIKKKLDIHSPSKESGKLGRFTGIGFADELEAQVPLVEKASTDIADAALDGMDVSKQIGRMRAAMSNEKAVIGSNMTMKVVHEYMFNGQNELIKHISQLRDMQVKLSREDIIQLAREFSEKVAQNISDEMEGMSFRAYDREVARLVKEVR